MISFSGEGPDNLRWWCTMFSLCFHNGNVLLPGLLFNMKRYVFLYNRTSCIGCGSCQAACKDEHHLVPGEFFRRVSMQCVEAGGEKKFFPLSASCNHCEKPACTDVCPTGAMYQTEEGLVLHNDEACIACGRCFWACPYGEISMSKATGMAQKCDSCVSRRDRGLEPACVAACPTKSLVFADREELSGEKFAAEFLPDFEETEPSTLLNRAFPREDRDER